MASNVRRGNENQKILCELQFDSGLQSVARASLIIEFLKFILYERQQIPSPFEQVKHELKLLIEDIENVNVKKKPNSARLQMKKVSTTVKNLDSLFGKIENAFEVCPEISQVLVLFGSTPVSPKEHYLINLPPLNPDADSLSSKRCVQTMMRQLVMNDAFGKMKNISTISMFLFFHAPRDCGLQWFVPKPSYKIPSRGREVILSLTCNQPTSSSLLDTHFEDAIEISGIEPLDSSVLHRSSIEGSKETLEDSYHSATDTEIEHSTPSVISLNSTGGDTITNISQKSQIENNSHSDCDSDADSGEVFFLCDQDYLWFQSPIVVKGFKNKIPVSSGANWF